MKDQNPNRTELGILKHLAFCSIMLLHFAVVFAGERRWSIKCPGREAQRNTEKEKYTSAVGHNIHSK